MHLYIALGITTSGLIVLTAIRNLRKSGEETENLSHLQATTAV